MEVQDTVMEARGPSDVNTVDTAASQPRYSLRSTDKVNRRESSVTRVDPYHCSVAETEKQHSSPPPPHSPDLTLKTPIRAAKIYVVGGVLTPKHYFSSSRPPKGTTLAENTSCDL